MFAARGRALVGLRRSFSAATQPLPPEAVSAFRRDGWCCVQGFWTQDETRALGVGAHDGRFLAKRSTHYLPFFPRRPPPLFPLPFVSLSCAQPPACERSQR